MGHDRLHAGEHVDGTDDIQDATDSVKGLATSTQITKLDGIDESAVDAAGAVTAMGAKADGNPLNHDKPIFGSEYDEDSSEGESTTTDATYVGNEKLKLTTPSLPAGDYYIGWSYEATNSNRDKCTMVQVELDDATQLLESCKPKIQNNNEYVGCSGHIIQTLTAAVHTIDIDFKAVSDTAKIRRARIVMWRVA